MILKRLHVFLIVSLLFSVHAVAAKVTANPLAISSLLNRIGGVGTSDRFVTRLDENLLTNGKDKFIIDNQDGKPYIQGSSITAIAAGINWYLNHDAHINISWNQLTADIAGASLPTATQVQKTCDATYRYYLNYCTFGYSMTTWTWDRWQKEIDWMALHGINMPLQIVGLEEVWRQTLLADGYTDAEAKAFAAGPAYIAWWGMNNLESWGGTQDDEWFAHQAQLGRNICNRMLELGMQPVLPGFSGMVPSNYPEAESQGTWCGFQRPFILDPTSTKFSVLATKYYQQLHKVLGKSNYYSMDPFHEGGTISSGKYAEGYKAIYDAMNANCGNNSKWVIQQWQWARYQQTSLTAVPAGRLIVLDLFSDGKPAFDSYNGYAPQEAIFCAIPNFGGRSGFMGRLANMSGNYFTYKNKYPGLKGIGAAPEAIESVPVVYDLLFELPWMETAPNIKQWVADYTTSRYGTENSTAQSAWNDILHSAMAFGADAIQGPIEDVWAARPNLEAHSASTWGKTISQVSDIYTPERRMLLVRAFTALLSESKQLDCNNYRYDLIEIGSQVMADYAYDLLLQIKDAREAGDKKRLNQLQESFLALILDVDKFKGTHPMFRLGNWLNMAHDNNTDLNARMLITTWGDYRQSDEGKLHDYSYRSWQGMLKDFYYPRWQYYFSHAFTAPPEGWFPMEWKWAHQSKQYTPAPQGNTIKQARKLIKKYKLNKKQNNTK